MLMHKILQNHLLCAFVANMKIGGIYALYPESFCDKNLASPCSPRAPNLLHLLPSRMVGWHKLCSPVFSYVLLFAIFSLSSPICFSYFPLLPTFSFLCFFIFFPNSPTSILPFFPILPIFPYFPLNIFSYTLFPSRKLEVGDLINKLI